MIAVTHLKHPSLVAYLLLTFTTLCWGGNAVLGRLAVGEVSPMMVVSLRWVGTLLLLTLVARKHIARDWPVLRKNLPFLAIMGALGFAGFNSLFYLAAHSTTAINLGIIQGSIPVFVLLGALVAYRTPVTPLQFGGVSITMIGVVIVGSGGDMARLATLAFNFGDLIMIGACLLYAGYTVALRQRPQVSSLSLLTFMAGAAFAASIVFAAAEATLGLVQWPTPFGWLIIGLITLFPSFLAQICFIRGVELLGPGRAGVFINLVPVFASILAVIFLNEQFKVFHGVALALVLSGIWLSERGKPT